MDDKEKSLFDSFADTIKHTFDIAAEAASKALQPEPLRPDEELVVIPTPPDAFVSEPSPPMVMVVKKKLPKKSAVDTSGRITPNYDIPIPHTPIPSPQTVAKGASKKPAKKAPAKAAKKASKKTVKKPAKKTVKKSAKNSKAKSSAKQKAAPTVTKKKAKKSKR